MLTEKMKVIEDKFFRKKNKMRNFKKDVNKI